MKTDARISVALVARRYDHAGGGAERWVHQHALHLLEAGFRVMLVAERITGAPAGAASHTVDFHTRWHRHTAWDFAEAAATVVTGLQPDVTVDMGCTWAGDVVMPHFGTRAANERARIALRSPLQRLVRRVTRPFLPRAQRLLSLERAVLAGPNVRCVVAVSAMTAGHLQRDTGTDPTHIKTVYNGVDLERFKPAGNAARQESRAALGLDERPVCLLIAHDFTLKGVPTAVRAIGHLHANATREKPAPLLLIVGQDPARPIERLAQRLGVEHLVRLEGPREDVRRYYQAADLLIHPTYYDPCSLVALEAVASGVPVVTTPCNGAVERLRPGRDSLLLSDPSDHRALAGLIAEATQPSVWNRLRAGTLQTGPTLSSTEAAKQLTAIYHTIASDRRERGLTRSGRMSGAAPASSAVSP